MFRNLQIYRLPAGALAAMGRDSLNFQLCRGPFLPCPKTEPMSRGWGQVADASFAHAVGRFWFLRLDIEERKVPARAVELEARKRAEDMEAQQGYKPGRKQMRELKERIAQEALPGILPTRRSTAVWIDPVDGWLGIDAATVGRAEEVLVHLRWCLDDFPLALVKTQLSPTSAMADWLASGEGPAEFTVDRECELKAVGEEKAAVRYTRHNLDMTEIKDHLAAGKLPTRLALTWNDRLSFVLTEKLEIKRLAFLDIVMGEAAAAENADEQADADRAIMSGEFVRFLPALVAALGGEVRE